MRAQVIKQHFRARCRRALITLVPKRHKGQGLQNPGESDGERVTLRRTVTWIKECGQRTLTSQGGSRMNKYPSFILFSLLSFLQGLLIGGIQAEASR